MLPLASNSTQSDNNYYRILPRCPTIYWVPFEGVSPAASWSHSTLTTLPTHTIGWPWAVGTCSVGVEHAQWSLVGKYLV